MAPLFSGIRSLAIPRPVASGSDGGSHVERFVSAVALGGVAAIVTGFFLWRDLGFGSIWPPVLFFILISLDQATDLRFIYRQSGIKKDSTELFLMTLAVLSTPLAALLALLAAGEVGLLIRRKSLLKHLFNLGDFAISAFAFFAVATSLHWAGLPYIPALACGAITYYLVNGVQVAVVVAYADGIPLREVLYHEGGVQLLVLFGNVALGALCAIAALQSPFYLLFMVPAVFVLHFGYTGRMRSMTDRERLALMMEATRQTYLPESQIEIEQALPEIAKQLVSCQKAELHTVKPEAAADEAVIPVGFADETRWLLVGESANSRVSSYDRELLQNLAAIATSAFNTVDARRLRKEIEIHSESDKVRNDLLASLSHELRTPLTSIIGFSQVLLLGRGDPTRSEEYLKMIHSQAVQLSGLVETLLDYQTLRGKGTRELKIEQLDLKRELEEMVETYRASAGFEIDLSCDSDLLVACDRVRIHQVIENLLSNAIKYSPNGGKIQVRGNRQGDDQVVVEVEDQGLGIPEDARDGIFSRFYRVRNSATEHIAGTGLGLAFCKEVVDAHGGTIDYVSEEGKGSLFRFELKQRPVIEQAA